MLSQQVRSRAIWACVCVSVCMSVLLVCNRAQSFGYVRKLPSVILTPSEGK